MTLLLTRKSRQKYLGFKVEFESMLYKITKYLKIPKTK